jgi:hypothetical protein
VTPPPSGTAASPSPLPLPPPPPPLPRHRCHHRRTTAAAAQGHAELADAVEHTLDICDDEEFAPHADIPVAPTLNGSRAERFEAMLEALDSVSVPEEGRKNVRQTPDQLLQGMVMGAVCYRKTGEVRTSAQMRERPNLTKLLVRFATESGELKEGFTFTSIQVNKNYASALHCDRNNFGPSYIVGLGDYEGGELWTQDKVRVACKL